MKVVWDNENGIIAENESDLITESESGLRTERESGLINESGLRTDLKTSKLFLFAPVVEGCDQNYNNLRKV